MNILRLTILIALVLTIAIPKISSANTTKTDPVIEWNTIHLNLIKTENTTPPAAAREMAIVNTAIFEAVNSINKSYYSYDIPVETNSNASTEAAAISAAYHTLKHLYPTHTQILTNLHNDNLSDVSTNKSIEEGIIVGKKAAEHIIELRSNDNHNKVKQHYSRNEIGKWRPTLPTYAPALYPHWSLLVPFSKIDLRQFLPPGPPDIYTQEYANEVIEVQKIGSKNSSVRTQDQTEIAYFWQDGPGTFTPPGHWNVIAQEVSTDHDYTLVENARLFALLNIAMADASILCWDAKYSYDLWRPITAIRNADIDGNSLTTVDPNWEPLINTPPFPEYTSGHSTFSGAASAILASEFGDNIHFTVYDTKNPEIQRSFTSFSQAAGEAMNSRLYGGIHFKSGNYDGLVAGRSLGAYIAQYMLQPKNLELPDTAASVTNWTIPNNVASSSNFSGLDFSPLDNSRFFNNWCYYCLSSLFN